MASPTDFDTFTETYKEVRGHKFPVDVMVPSTPSAASHPVLVTLHGGALMTGSRTSLQPWLKPFAAAHSAILVAPDYRLLPEGTASDIVEDLADFWTWLVTSLPTVIAARYGAERRVDLKKVAVSGGSAGGWCAAHLALMHPDHIAILMLQYPLVQTISEVTLNGSDGRPPPGLNPLLKEQVEERLQAITYRDVVTDGSHPDRTTWTLSAAHWGYLADFIGYDSFFNPTDRVRTGVRLPSNIWVLQGEADHITKADEARTFLALVRKFCRSTKVRADYVPDQPHAFDLSWTGPALDEGLAWSAREWLA